MDVWQLWMQKDSLEKKDFIDKSSSMFTIHLTRLIFTAYHGIHEEEKICSGEFEVNLELKLSEQEGVKIADLSQTIDYTIVFEVVKKAMNQPTPLLETIIQHIEAELLLIFPKLEFLFIKIEKMKPPMMNINGSVAVSFQKKYNDTSK